MNPGASLQFGRISLSTMVFKTGHRFATADFFTPLTLCNLPVALQNLTFTSFRGCKLLAFARSRECKNQQIQQDFQFYTQQYL
jgi:hypothetical protein